MAIWNIKNYKLSFKDGKILVNGSPLIFYHFTNLKQIDKNLFSTDLSRVFVSLKGILLNKIYLPYINLLVKNKLSNVKIAAKKDNHVRGISSTFRELTRKIRSILFVDTIKISAVK